MYFSACVLHVNKFTFIYFFTFRILSSFRRKWAAFLGAWCPLLVIRSCFVRSLLLKFLKFLALDTIRWWRVRSRNCLFSSPRDSFGEILEKVVYGPFLNLTGKEGWQLPEMVYIMCFIKQLFPLLWCDVSSFPPYHLQWSVFQNGISSLGSKVMKSALSLVGRKQTSFLYLLFNWLPKISNPQLFFHNHIQTM